MKAYVEPEEVALMEKTTTNLRDRLLIRLLFHLGCRVSEALGLTVEDADFDHGTISIKHLKARLKLSCTECGQRLGKSHTFCPKCGEILVRRTHFEVLKINLIDGKCKFCGHKIPGIWE